MCTPLRKKESCFIALATAKSNIPASRRTSLRTGLMYMLCVMRYRVHSGGMKRAVKIIPDLK